MQRKTQDGRKKSKEAQKEIRNLAITYWLKHGNMLEAAREFNVSYPAIRKWVKKYKQGGPTKLHVDE